MMKNYFDYGRGVFILVFLASCFSLNAQSNEAMVFTSTKTPTLSNVQTPLQRTVTGVVTSSEDGQPLPGVSVLIVGTSTGTITNIDGKYDIEANSDQVLRFSFIGFVGQEVQVGNSNVLDVSLEPDVEQLEEVIVTGYTSERKADIIGSVGVVDAKNALSTPSANIAQQLQGRAAGVTISGDGAPGEGAKVRIRGFTSFGQSNPLYVIDGVPTQDPATINPNDIESIQVLKDATAASIYGARAAQGVIIITTKRGSEGKIDISYNGYVGTTKVPERSYLDVINTEQYLDYLQRSQPSTFVHPVFGQMSSATIPEYIVSSPGFKGGVSANDSRADPSLYDISDYGAPYQILKTSAGTNWFDEILQQGLIQSHQISATGGNSTANYAVSFNYFNQEGTHKYTDYTRYSARVNSSFKPNKWFSLGENLQIINEESNGSRTRGEGGPWGWAYRYVPYIPVYDIGGGFGGNSVGESGNASNPVAVLTREQYDTRQTWRIFGNMFAEVSPIKNLKVRSSFGIDFNNAYNEDYAFKSYENSENRGLTAYGVNNNSNLTWTWTNTANYTKNFGAKHQVKLLAGTEAINRNVKGIGVSTNTYDFEDPNFINLNTDQFSTPNAYDNQAIRESLYSLFGRVDYIFADKYLFNATIRRDETSKLYEDVRYGTFPAFGVGWRISEESFMQTISWIEDLKIRGGWGQMGSINNVDANNQFTLYNANVGSSFYDINRTNNSATVGYRPSRTGSLTTQWEYSETTNIGFDATLFDGIIDLTVDWYQNNTNDLLVQKVAAPTEPQVAQPYINLGQMVNKGFDISVTNRNQIGNFSYDATLIFSRYVNEVTNIDGNPETFISRGGDRISDIVRTKAGNPIASFWGWEIDPNDRFFDTQEEIDALEQDGAVVGSWKYVDQNGDGKINNDDQTFLGNPHPDFVTSLNLDLKYKNFDFNIFLVWNQGNDLFNNVSYFTDMRVFVGAVSERVVNQDWRPGQDNSGATHPRLAPGAESGYTAFTRTTSNSFYVEDGSFLRGRTAQLGYTFNPALISKIGLGSARIYLQAQNFFTITNYSGSDPDINIQGGDDLTMGVDRGAFPSIAQYLIGLNFSL